MIGQSSYSSVMLFGEHKQNAFAYSVKYQVNYVPSDSREASLLFSYAKEVSESGALDQDENSEDVTGG